MYFVLGGGTLLIMRGGFFSTYYISLSIFLGFAATYPDMQVLLYFIIPIKIKWLAWLDVIFLAWQMIQSGWTTRVAIICSLMNFIIYFFATRNLARYSPHEVKRKRTYAKAVHKSQESGMSQSISARSAGERRKTETIWNFVSVQNAEATMNIVRIIYLHTNIYNKELKKYEKTKIVCTMGPNTDKRETMKQLIEAGMDIARFNFSHGTHEEQKARMDMLKEVRAEMKKPIAILLDTKGPEIRTGLLDEHTPVTLKSGDTFTLTTNKISGNQNICHQTYEGLPLDVKRGARILVDDGLIELKVESTSLIRMLYVPW